MKDMGAMFIASLALMSTIGFTTSNHFSKPQKIILGILLVFPPAQWLLGAILYFYNRQTETTQIFEIEKADKSMADLFELKQKEILSDEEYNKKVEILEEEIINKAIKRTVEFKQLQKLKNKNLLSEDEFLSKINLLKTNFKNEKKRY